MEMPDGWKFARNRWDDGDQYILDMLKEMAEALDVYRTMEQNNTIIGVVEHIHDTETISEKVLRKFEEWK